MVHVHPGLRLLMMLGALSHHHILWLDDNLVLNDLLLLD